MRIKLRLWQLRTILFIHERNHYEAAYDVTMMTRMKFSHHHDQHCIDVNLFWYQIWCE